MFQIKIGLPGNCVEFPNVQKLLIFFPSHARPRSCSGDPCLNGGTCRDFLGGYTCTCPADNPAEFGPDCERLAASFNGEGWSWQRGLEACGDARISLYFSTQVGIKDTFALSFSKC